MAGSVAEAGYVPPHVVSERLGHSSVSVTLDIYVHVIPTQGTDAARIVGDTLYGADTGTDG